MSNETVSKDMHDGRCQIEDERFARDKERIEKTEENLHKISEASVLFTEILKRHECELDDHGKRIVAIESKPSKLVNAAQIAAISALASSLVAGVVALILK